MKVYKIKDKADGNLAFVVAQTEQDAIEKILTRTVLEVEVIGIKPVEELEPLIILNKINPF